MTQQSSFPPGEPVTVKCFSFYNPDSINGPFGTFQLWIESSNVAGRMTIQVLFGLGATTTLNLTGTLAGTNPIVCTLQGEGFIMSFGEPTLSVSQGISLSFASDWSTGQLTFSDDGGGTGGGLPVTEVDCTQ